jgi:hypothetical protein
MRKSAKLFEESPPPAKPYATSEEGNRSSVERLGSSSAAFFRLDTLTTCGASAAGLPDMVRTAAGSCPPALPLRDLRPVINLLAKPSAPTLRLVKSVDLRIIRDQARELARLLFGGFRRIFKI